MSKSYPLVFGYRRKPKKEMDGGVNYGKPCVFCGTGTCGEMWVQISYMRGDDETVRVCSDHWKKTSDEVIKAYQEAVPDDYDYNLAN